MTAGREIRTERLLLRPFRMSDAPALHVALSNPCVMRYWGNYHRNLKETEDYVRMTIEADPDTSADFVIECDGEILGKAGMWREPEIGYFVLPEHQRRGIATEALRAVLPWLFKTFEMQQLTADVDPRNAASIRLLKRLGFRETHRNVRTTEVEGHWCDSVYLALNRI